MSETYYKTCSCGATVKIELGKDRTVTCSGCGLLWGIVKMVSYNE
jgi:DNA-directed RNA polymerase subunit RPC12/RpoP